MEDDSASVNVSLLRSDIFNMWEQHGRIDEMYISDLNMSLQGLPPLPKSLSTVNLAEPVNGNKRTHHHKLPPPPPPPGPRQPPPPPPRKQTKLDVQLARLRKEMYSLRELDLSLLSQLWSLNESLQEFRAMQEMMSPHSDPEEDALYSNLPPLHEGTYPLSSSSSRSSNNAYTEL